MVSTIVFWVLIAITWDGKAMVSQQFVSHAGCIEAKAFLENTKGSYIAVKCVRDQAVQQ